MRNPAMMMATVRRVVHAIAAHGCCYSRGVRRFELALTLLALPLLSPVVGCGGDDPSDEMPATDSETGDGDGDPGDGDGDPGDGDGDPGDGDGDPGDGDGDGDGDPGDGDGDGDPACIYPAAAEPMALDEPIAAYAWPVAIHGDGTHTPLDLEQAHCDTDAIIDWSPHEILVFISVPAW
jgi:hypothetical protein